MNKILFYLPRILSILIVGFVAIFILEGLSPEFSWIDSLMHLLLTLVVLGITIVSWKWPKIGGWIFILLGLRYLLDNYDSELSNALIIGGIPLITGILFLIQGYKK
jgi:hypothetical protein